MKARWKPSEALVKKRWTSSRVVVVMMLGHLWVGLRLTDSVSAIAWWGVMTALVLGGSLVAIASGVLARSWEESPRRRAAQWIGYTSLGFFSSVFVLTILREFAMILLDNAGWLSAELLTYSSMAVWAAALSMTVVGFFNATCTAKVKLVEIPIKGLPRALHGFTIAQLSDIHVGPFIRRVQIEKMVARANAIDADLIAITGDVVDGGVDHLREHTEPLGRLVARSGTLLVLGNHDCYCGAEEWTAEFQRLGITVLNNEHRVIERDECKLVIAGVTDYTTHKFVAHLASDPRKALEGAPEDAAVKILLAHQPRTAAQAEGLGYDLQCSGHSHGGQFFPWGYFVPLQQPMVKGLHTRYGMQVFVSIGTGFWGPPKRFPHRAEIARLRLVAARND